MAKRGTKEWRKAISASKVKHGDASHTNRAPEYRIWSLIVQRCTNPNNPAYPSYGGRGIKVCKRWLKYENFIADLGYRPGPKYSVERSDNSKGYHPNNCSWQPKKAQQRNMRSNRMLTHRGKTMCLSAWAEKVGLSPKTLATRLRMGWKLHEALTRPLRGASSTTSMS